MYVLSFGVNSISFYISALFYLITYTLMSFPKCSLSLKSVDVFKRSFKVSLC
jgi:hypothetical protein